MSFEYFVLLQVCSFFVCYCPKGFSFYNMDYGFVKQLIWLLTRRFPERLGRCLLLNAPLIFSGCWSIIRLWLVTEIPYSTLPSVRGLPLRPSPLPLSQIPCRRNCFLLYNFFISSSCLTFEGFRFFFTHRNNV